MFLLKYANAVSLNNLILILLIFFRLKHHQLAALCFCHLQYPTHHFRALPVKEQGITSLHNS